MSSIIKTDPATHLRDQINSGTEAFYSLELGGTVGAMSELKTISALTVERLKFTVNLFSHAKETGEGTAAYYDRAWVTSTQIASSNATQVASGNRWMNFNNNLDNPFILSDKKIHLSILVDSTSAKKSAGDSGKMKLLFGVER